MELLPDDPDLTGKELLALLIAVYVGGGFTDEAVAPALFAPEAVRARGTIITARENGVLAGMVILVPPDGAARHIARDGETEIHLLAVRRESRGRGVGQALLKAVLTLAGEHGWPRVVLSTQEQMTAAHKLYLNAGFQRVPERDWTRGTRRFLAYTLTLAA